MLPLRMGSRGSKLALAQVAFVEEYLRAQGTPYTIHIIKTSGDIIQDRPLYEIGGKALFSKEIERALLEKKIDLAVHSLKDLETPRPRGLKLCAYLKRADARDVLVHAFDEKTNMVSTCHFEDLLPGAVIGTSSPRRRALALYHRGDLRIESLRGNVPTRLQKIGQTCDAALMAKAGLDRLGYILKGPILSLEDHPPAAGQGIVVLECRSDDSHVEAMVAALNDPAAEKAALIERGIIERLGASCRSAVGLYVVVSKEKIHLHAFLQKEKASFFSKTYEGSMSFLFVIEDAMLFLSLGD